MRVPIALPLLLAAAALAEAGGVTKLDSPPKPEWVTVKADPLLTTLTVDKAAKWVLVDDGPTCDLRPAADGKTATFAASAPGRYRVLVVAGEEVHRVAVQVADPPQPMPPGPGPKPPDPPKPADPLVTALQAAYDAEPGTAEAKAKQLGIKIELYRQIGELVVQRVPPGPGQKAEDMPYKLTAVGQTLAKLNEAADNLDPGKTLTGVRKVIRGELQAAFPEDVPLTPDTRKKLSELFGRIKAALEQVK